MCQKGVIMIEPHPSPIAYFSMEIGLEPDLPTYAGGLGVLAGDCLRAAADLGVDIVGVTLIDRKGYFKQHLDVHGNQTETPVVWKPEDRLEKLQATTSVNIMGRKVLIQAWRYIITGHSGWQVPVILLDTQLPENAPDDQAITDTLYGGNDRYRLCQEVVLGMGGVAMLQEIGYTDIAAYHMNEGHSALLALALFVEQSQLTGHADAQKSIEHVREKCVFTTHTPVPAGMDRFSNTLVTEVLGEELTGYLVLCDCLHRSNLNMIYLALFFSRYINGVSMRHEEISHGMFPNYPISSITNGVHAGTWVSGAYAKLFDRHIPEWRSDNLYLRYIINVPVEEIRTAHLEAKTDLFNQVFARTGKRLNLSVLTLGFARRMTAYKRADLIFTDIERLKRISKETGPLQIIYSGKAHPRDIEGKDLIRHVFRARDALQGIIDVVFLEDYDMAVGKAMCAGVDLWLNTPQRPYEASGTSGMKAAMNGVPSLSVLDGWWVEGHVEGVTGWSVGDSYQEINPSRDADSLYEKLEKTIVPMFYQRPAAFDELMRMSVALNGSYYNAERMMRQYRVHAYNPRKNLNGNGNGNGK